MDPKYQATYNEARECAIDVATEIIDLANTKDPTEIRPFGGLVAALVFQDMMITFAADMYRPGSKLGAEWIAEMYTNAANDALKRWDQRDLYEYKCPEPTGEVH